MAAAQSNFSDIQSSILRSLVSLTRSTNSLCAEDLPFQKSYDRNIGRAVDEQSTRLLHLAQRLIASVTEGQEQQLGLQLETPSDVDDKWKDVVDVIDSLLERADTSLDEFGGYLRRVKQTEEIPSSTSISRPSSIDWNATRTHNEISKPQTAFEVPVDNFSTSPFRPLLTSKPHAIKSLDESLEETTDKKGIRFFPHPYETEITNYTYPESMYKVSDPIPCLPFETTTATLVDTPEALQKMLEELKNATEIAIDLEHHDQRSYIGIVSLMQISTREKDWIVDTLKPWRRKLECLNEVFANPRILKVLHGAFMDAIWLQRDLGLYLVGLFDTHYACKALKYPAGSLAYLLQRFVNFKAQKQYQMADWRQRPLPQALFDYARADTHFLLYVFDNLRNELATASEAQNEDLFDYVLRHSKDTALNRYENPSYDARHGQGSTGWYKQMLKTPASLTNEQFAVFRAVHGWRDHVARSEDESVNYILKNHSLLEIARALPTSKPELFALITQPSSPIRSRIDELLQIVVSAKEIGAQGPSMEQILGEADKVYEEDQLARRPNRWLSVVQQTATPSLVDNAVQPEVLIPSKSSLHPAEVAKALPAQGSAFWGQVISTAFGQKRSYTQDVRLAFPMPDIQYDHNPVEEGLIHSELLSVGNPTAPAVQPVDTGSQNDGIFTLRQFKGSNKKRSATEAQLASDSQSTGDGASGDGEGYHSNSEEGEINSSNPTTPSALGKIPIDNTFDERSDLTRSKSKRAAKAARKAAKKAAEASSMADGNRQNGATEEEAAFDYANAASVVHANSNKAYAGGKFSQRSKAKKAGFDMYSRAMDAPKGLPKVQKGGPGKSGTWTK